MSIKHYKFKMSNSLKKKQFHLAYSLQRIAIMRLQRTLQREVRIEGIGLHTGRHASITLSPAPRDHGIVFYRKNENTAIHANVNAICETSFATTLGSNGSKIRTVEHLLAALAGLGIDNLIIEVDGPEIPILDGSSMGFVEAISGAGIVSQSARRPHLVIVKPFGFADGDAEFTAVPYNGRRITCRTFYPHRLLGAQQMAFEVREDTFRKEIAPARTFGFLKDVQHMRSKGLAKGGSLDNAIILSDTGLVNVTGLRFKDEFLRHKLLDFIGDVSLIGFPIQGHLSAAKSGHGSNLKFVQALLASPECWELDSAESSVPVRKAVNFKYA